MMPLTGLYAITDTRLLTEEQLLNGVEQAILGGARIIQYRDKNHDATQRQQQASTLLPLCQQHQVPLIINDDIQLALKIGADGVHLGRDDGHIEEARAILGDTAIIGISCYNEPERALTAHAAGADYVAFGAFFSSSTKPLATAAEPALLREIKQSLSIPVVAIGGITPGNGALLIDAGADMLAVVAGVFGQADIRLAAQQYAQLFNE